LNINPSDDKNLETTQVKKDEGLEAKALLRILIVVEGPN